jgi:hypothetical protein
MSSGERRRIIVGLSIAGALGVFFLVKFVVFGGGGGGSSNSASPTGTRRPGSVLIQPDSTTSTSEASRSTSPPATFDVFATKNPFEPVIIVTPPDTTPDTTPLTTPGGGTVPDTTPGGGTIPSGSTSTTIPSVNPSPGTSVALRDVFPAAGGVTHAKVQVGSTVYTVGVGTVFATSYRVVSLSGQCGQFLFGDAPFKLCEGEEVIK